jgi:hypothetical protein
MMMMWRKGVHQAMGKIKRILCIVSLMLGLIMLPNGEQTEAADVWVSHWNSEGIDVYIKNGAKTPHRNSRFF